MDARIDQASCDVRAVVGASLQVCEQVEPYVACIHRTVSCLHSLYMSRSQLLLEIVDDLLERLHILCDFKIHLQIRSRGDLNDLLCCVGDDAHLMTCFIGELDFLPVYLFRRLKDIHRMVCDPLIISYDLEKKRDPFVVCVTDISAAELDEE